MPVLELEDGKLAYEILGSGDPLILTPGGRFSRNVPGVRPLAEALAERYAVVIWDRRNTGESSMCFEGLSESQLWADDLATLVRALELGPAHLCGGSAGSRTSILAAIRHPDVVRTLAVWLISGGIFGQMYLPVTYNIPFILAARRGGMEAVAALPEFAEQLAGSPENRDYLLRFDPEDFIALMKRWMASYVPRENAALPGIPDTVLGEISVPTLVFRSGRLDDFHPRATSEAVAAAIAGARLVDPPWSEDAWEDARRRRDAGQGDLFDNWVGLAPQLVDFLESG